MKPKRICFFRLNNHIGDVLVTSFFIRELKKRFVNDKLTVVATSPIDQLYQNNPYIDDLLCLPPICYLKTSNMNAKTPLILNSKVLWGLFQILLEIRKRHYDLIITDAIIPTWRNRLYFKLCGAKQTILPILDNTTFRQHISVFYKEVLVKLGVKDVNCSYEIYISPQAQEEANKFLRTNSLTNNLVIFNPLASIEARSMSNCQIELILDSITRLYPNLPVVLLDYKQQYQQFAKKAILCHLDIESVAALFKQAMGIITVDTSTVHLADVFQKPMLSIYAHNRYSFPNNIYIFGSTNPKTIFLQSHDKVADIPLNLLEEKLQQFLDGLPGGKK